jgi:Mg2+/Co2+ transporter CorC
VDVRIGVINNPKELVVELEDTADREALHASITASLGMADGVVVLTDKKGRDVIVPVARIAYVEIGAALQARQIGFGG